MINYKETYCLDGWISFPIPHDWSILQDAELVTVYNPKGLGALQLSFAKRTRNTDLKHDALELLGEFLEGQGIAYSSAKVSCVEKSGFVVASYNFVQNNDESGSNYFKVWQIVEKDRSVFVTYVCSMEDKEKESDIVESIMKGIRFV